MYKFLILLGLFAGFQQASWAACKADSTGTVICGRGDCATDTAGNVFCSKYLFGGAKVDELGNVVCGKGQCIASTKFKEHYCSAVESGGADIDRFGVVKCYGGCEPASALMCESQQGR